LSCYTKPCRPLKQLPCWSVPIIHIIRRRPRTWNRESAARSLGLRLLVFNVTADSEIAPVFAMLVEHQAGVILVGSSVIVHAKRDQIISLAARFALPTMFSDSTSDAQAGGLLSYSADLNEVFRQVGAYTGRILKGQKPGDLPVVHPTKFEFVTVWPEAARAQQQTKPTIGVLDGQLGGPPRECAEGFRQGLAEVRFSVGRDVTVEYYLGDGHPELLSALAADLVRRRPAAIVAHQGFTIGCQSGDSGHTNHFWNGQ
jgi:ABC transporter substrate binding protein